MAPQLNFTVYLGYIFHNFTIVFVLEGTRVFNLSESMDPKIKPAQT